MPRMSVEDWKARVIAERGDPRAGNFGEACPSCWKKLPGVPTDREEYCACGELADPVKILRAHGLEDFAYAIQSNDSEPVLD